jgi:hypothetical protein
MKYAITVNGNAVTITYNSLSILHVGTILKTQHKWKGHSLYSGKKRILQYQYHRELFHYRHYQEKFVVYFFFPKRRVKFTFLQGVLSLQSTESVNCGYREE